MWLKPDPGTPYFDRQLKLTAMSINKTFTFQLTLLAV